MRRLLSIFFSILLICFKAQDSKQLKIDSLKQALEKDSARIFGFKEFRPFIRYAERNSIGNPHPINFFGPQAGLVINEYHMFGAAFYLSSPYTRRFYDYMDGNRKVTEGLDMRYLSLFYEYILIQKRYYEVHLPIEVSYGYYHAAYKDSSGVIYRSVNDKLLIGGAGLLLNLKPLRWIGLTGSMGYRESNYQIVNGFYYMVGVWIGLKNLAGDINYHYIKKKRYRKNVQEVLKP